MAAAMLFFTVLCIIVSVATPCQKVANYYGYMADDQKVIETVSSSDSCSCCALCHQIANCSSFSINLSSRQCRLYGIVASLTSLIRRSSYEYYFMPHRSTSGQMCSTDSDCIDGERCLAYICTSDSQITCYDLYKSWKLSNYYWISLNGTLLYTHCWSGYTRVMHTGEQPWTAEQVLERNPTKIVSYKYSILKYVEHHRKNITSATYKLLIYASGYDSDDNIYSGWRFQVSKDVSLIANQPYIAKYWTFGTRNDDVAQPSVPFIPSSSERQVLLTVDPESGGMYGQMVSSNGTLKWSKRLTRLRSISYYYMEE